MRLEGVKKGDTIIVPSRHYVGPRELYEVERVTATQAVCKGASFKIDSGLMIGTGSGWYSRHGWIASENEITSTRLAQRARVAQEKISRIKVTPDNLAAAEAFIAASQPKTETNNQGE